MSYEDDDQDNDTSGEPAYLTRGEVLDHANEIAQEFARDGMDITLRQLYYQFVARGLCLSGQKAYKRIGDVVTEARYTGDFPLELLVDRGRDIHMGDYTRHDIDVEQALADSGGIIRGVPDLTLNTDRWYGQPVFVSVWVEKQALEGVFSSVCTELGVSWFACKGYPSVSALWQWLKRAAEVTSGKAQNRRFYWPGGATITERHQGCAERAVVLYFGDHDPDGWEIPRSAERNLRSLMELRDIDLDLTFKRIGLNMNQIIQYNPPPFEAKITSARYRGYVDEHSTNDAWELDALNPRVLRDLIRKEVGAQFDQRIYNANEGAVESAREEMRDRMARGEFMRRVFNSDEGEE